MGTQTTNWKKKGGEVSQTALEFPNQGTHSEKHSGATRRPTENFDERGWAKVCQRSSSPRVRVPSPPVHKPRGGTQRREKKKAQLREQDDHRTGGPVTTRSFHQKNFVSTLSWKRTSPHVQDPGVKPRQEKMFNAPNRGGAPNPRHASSSKSCKTKTPTGKRKIMGNNVTRYTPEPGTYTAGPG